MIAWRTLARRNALIAVGTTALTLLVAAMGLRPTIRGGATRVLLATHEVMGHYLVDACVADPVHFGVKHPDIEIYAYDPENFQSANPLAPVPDPALVALYRAGEKNPLLLFSGDGPGGGALVDSPGKGPCGVAYVHWPQPPTQRIQVLFWLSAVGLVALSGGTALATSLTVRPLVRHLHALRAAADQIGTPAYRGAPRMPEEPMDHLADVLDEAHQRILSARSEEQARRAALEEHLDDVAHDLRSPLAALQLRLEAVASHAPEGVQEALYGAMGDLTYLIQLTANLRANVALREPGQGPCELGALTARVGERFSVIGRHAGIAVFYTVPEHPVWIACEVTLAEQAIANLVYNAVRHNRSGGQVSLWLKSKSGRFSLEIVDDGPGVSPDKLAAMERSAPTRGRHLGLAITRAICEQYGWSMKLENLEVGGLAATLEGPLAEGTALSP